VCRVKEPAEIESGEIADSPVAIPATGVTVGPAKAARRASDRSIESYDPQGVQVVEVGAGSQGAAAPSSAVTPQATCQVLHLDLGAVNLNLLGVQSHYCPKDRRQAMNLVAFEPELKVGYAKLVTISTDDLLRHQREPGRPGRASLRDEHSISALHSPASSKRPRLRARRRAE